MLSFARSLLIRLGLLLVLCQVGPAAIPAQEIIRSGLGLNNENSLLGNVLQLDSTTVPSDGCQPVSVCEQDEVWMINGRNGHCNPCDLNLLSVQRMSQGQWQASTLDELIGAHTTDKSRTTLIYVHGDRTDDYWASARGLQFYQNVFVHSGEPRKGVRFVIWAWRSEKAQLRPCKDFSIKSSRAQSVGKSLASFLKSVPDQNLVLVGYSLGCQAFLVSLRELSGLRTAEECATAVGYRVLLLAPALDGHYVAEQCRQSQGSELVAEADIFDNSADRALKCSRVIGARVAAGGGQSIQQLAYQGSLPLSNISIFDLRNSVGNKHGVAYYSADPALGCRLRQMVDQTPNSDSVPASIMGDAKPLARSLK